MIRKPLPALLLVLRILSLAAGAELCGEAPPEAALAVAPSQALLHTAAVWPPSCNAASGPRCLLTNIISAGIYISLTTLSQNGIKSNTNDK